MIDGLNWKVVKQKWTKLIEFSIVVLGIKLIKYFSGFGGGEGG